MGDHSGPNPKFAAPQVESLSIPVGQNHFDESVMSAALERWVERFDWQGSCAEVPVQRSECRRAG